MGILSKKRELILPNSPTARPYMPLRTVYVRACVPFYPFLPRLVTYCGSAIADLPMFTVCLLHDRLGTQRSESKKDG